MSRSHPSQQPDPFAPVVYTASPGDERFHETIVPAERFLTDFPEARAETNLQEADFHTSMPAGTPIRLAAFRVVNVDQSAAHTDVLLDQPGNVIFFQQSKNATDQVTIKPDSKDNPPIPLYPGNGIIGAMYDRLFISNPLIGAGVLSTLLVANVAGAKLQVF
jgi:hypothetical protein